MPDNINLDNITDEEINDILASVDELTRNSEAAEERQTLYDSSVESIDTRNMEDNQEVYQDVVDDSNIENEISQSNEADDIIHLEPEDAIMDDSDLVIGDFVALDPIIADAVPDYSPDDEYRILNIDGDIVSLSRNGESVSYLSAIPINGIEKANYINPFSKFAKAQKEKKVNKDDSKLAFSKDDVEEVFSDDKKENKPIIEKGSKPIRWASHFIDKVRKNVSVEGISQKLEESIKNDEKMAKESDEPNLDGKTVSFKTSLYSKELKLATAASKGWKKITGWFKKDEKIADDKFFPEKNNNNETTDKSKDSGLINEVTSSVGASAKPYEEFEKLSKDKKAAVLEDLFAGLQYLQRELNTANGYNRVATQKLEESGEKLEVAREVLVEANDKIGELVDENEKLKARIEELENEKAVSETKEDIVEETKEDAIEETKEDVVEEIKEDVVEETKEDAVEETKEDVVEEETIANSNDELIELEKELDKILEGMESKGNNTTEKVEGKTEENDKEIIDEQYMKYVLNQYEEKDEKINPKNDEEITQEKDEVTSTFTEEEIAADKERRRKENYSYDREKQAEYEMFWQNQADYTQTPEYQQAAFERAEEDIKFKKEQYENSTIGQTSEEKAEWEAQREALIEKTNADAKRNEFMTNIHYGTYSDDQIAAMLSAINNEETKGKSK